MSQFFFRYPSALGNPLFEEAAHIIFGGVPSAPLIQTVTQHRHDVARPGVVGFFLLFDDFQEFQPLVAIQFRGISRGEGSHARRGAGGGSGQLNNNKLLRFFPGGGIVAAGPKDNGTLIHRQAPGDDKITKPLFRVGCLSSCLRHSSMLPDRRRHPRSWVRQCSTLAHFSGFSPKSKS